MSKTPYEKTMTRAMNLLSYKPRTQVEMRTRLMEKEWADASIVEQVIARLAELGYLNDEQFAANFANARLTAKPIGRTRLRQDLRRKKLDAQVVEAALDEAYEEHGEEGLIDRLVAKRIKLKGVPRSREESKKLFDYLLRRGFSYDLVMRKVRAVGVAVDEAGEAPADG